MSSQLWSAFQSISSIMNLTVVPYGNAKVMFTMIIFIFTSNDNYFVVVVKQETWRNETKLWQFTCQHGTDECWGNLLHSCLIYYYPQTADHLPFIHCMESDDQDDIRTAADKCSKQFNISMDSLNGCMNSRLGNNLEHQNAVQTDNLNPPHKYVPWVTLNGVHTEDIQNQAETNLIALICNNYQVRLT